VSSFACPKAQISVSLDANSATSIMNGLCLRVFRIPCASRCWLIRALALDVGPSKNHYPIGAVMYLQSSIAKSQQAFRLQGDEAR
jgi:hypothetical protein